MMRFCSWKTPFPGKLYQSTSLQTTHFMNVILFSKTFNCILETFAHIWWQTAFLFHEAVVWHTILAASDGHGVVFDLGSFPLWNPRKDSGIPELKYYQREGYMQKQVDSLIIQPLSWAGLSWIHALSVLQHKLPEKLWLSAWTWIAWLPQ